jgi:hypothetical protein
MRIEPTTAARLVALLAGVAAPAVGGELTVDLGGAEDVRLVGAVQRWDADGMPRFPVDPKAAIDAPRVDARAKPDAGGRWIFRDLPPGRYDLVILAGERIRVEGFHYPPVLELDPPLPPDAPASEEAREAIERDIAQTRHYENKVAPLYLGGDDKQVRVLVQLVRDLPTSFDADFGAPVATVRHEVWQYAYRYGTWTRDRRTKILDRILLPRDEFRQWTWVWVPALGGIEVGSGPVAITDVWPERLDAQSARGWFPECR